MFFYSFCRVMYGTWVEISTKDEFCICHTRVGCEGLNEKVGEGLLQETVIFIAISCNNPSPLQNKRIKNISLQMLLLQKRLFLHSLHGSFHNIVV